MKKFKTMFAGLLIIGMLGSIAGCGGDKAPVQDEKTAKKIIVGTEATYPPFEYVENGEYKGFDMDLIRAIAAAEGLEVEVSNLGFDSLIPALKSNTVDCVVAAMSITPERLKSIDFSEPYYDAGLIIAVAKDNTEIKSLEDLKGKKLAAQVGTIGADACNDIKVQDSSTEVRIFDGIGEAFMELEKGGVDAVINDLAVTADYIQGKGSSKAKMVGDVFSAEDKYGIGVKKGNAEMLTLMNDGLKKIKENGQYDKIYNQYFGNM